MGPTVRCVGRGHGTVILVAMTAEIADSLNLTRTRELRSLACASRGFRLFDTQI